MFDLTYALGFHWYGSQFGLGLMSLNNGVYKILDLIETDYGNEKEIEQYIQSMIVSENIKQVPPLKLIDKIVAEEIFQKNKYGYSVVECDLESEIKRLNLKLQNSSVTIDHSIADFVYSKLQRCTDYKIPGAAVAAMAIALHNFYPEGEIIRVGANTCGGWMDFKF